MRIGVPKEVKADEARVALTPAGAGELVARQHTVVFERGAGKGAGYPDESYEAAGAHAVTSAADVFDAAELIVKVKEPQPNEARLLTTS